MTTLTRRELLTSLAAAPLASWAIAQTPNNPDVAYGNTTIPRGIRSRLVTGVNWSPGIGNPFRTMGRSGASLDTLLQNQRVDEDCVVVAHLASPRVSYTDRGKSAVVIS